MTRLWGIRHVRYFYLSWRVYRWARQWGSVGIGLGYPNQSDVDHLQAIWRGEA
jgi:hypothetical protein